MLDENYKTIVEPYRQARRDIERSRAKLVFYAHLGAYVVGNLFLGGWNVLTYVVKKSDALWFFLPLLFWGVGLIVHYLQSVALFDEWWELDERNIDQKMSG